jgi:hypothetical protein
MAAQPCVRQAAVFDDGIFASHLVPRLRTFTAPCSILRARLVAGCQGRGAELGQHFATHLHHVVSPLLKAVLPAALYFTAVGFA